MPIPLKTKKAFLKQKKHSIFNTKLKIITIMFTWYSRKWSTISLFENIETKNFQSKELEKSDI